MPHFVEVNINPLILQWARIEAGYDDNEIAAKVDVTPDRYKNWELQGKNIPLGKLRSIANYYKRQLAVFFLPQVPEKLVKPKDYRNLKPDESKLSKEVLLVIRDVTYFRQMALELQGETYRRNRFEWINEAKKNAGKGEAFNKWLRELLNISLDDKFNGKATMKHTANGGWLWKTVLAFLFFNSVCL